MLVGSKVDTIAQIFSFSAFRSYFARKFQILKYAFAFVTMLCHLWREKVITLIEIERLKNQEENRHSLVKGRIRPIWAENPTG